MRSASPCSSASSSPGCSPHSSFLPMLETKKFSPPKQRAFDARFEAQKIVFGPVVFHCVHYAWKRGMLEALAEVGDGGATLDELEATGRWSRYALKLALESC